MRTLISVTSTAKAPYHHGDLRRAILRVALDVIAVDGPSALSLRDLARRAGVSHAAPAHHFKDRTGLLTAIAAEGFELLAAAIREATDLRDGGVRYVRFAREHPAHFQVMFTPELLRESDVELTTARALSTAALHDTVSTATPGNGNTEGSDTAGSDTDANADTRLARATVWSLAHGFATLLLSDNLDNLLDGEDPEEVFRALPMVLLPRTT
ncbi:TetR/AcrR family transcriptional regulator [Streptomyces acidicola]|uniref:TetR/AcrR family transcriptional regulator n=1 Tax=Streptomyces acidicola TaxID=2596892 RepID=A0A5N8X4W6_9ACTN|nr:TetR/AcrR family transcriptional regulator [Streptomyces acidicola]MPY54567.1 TetR/AcrR family transcriptional regulator [Streptomyces acidicola]